MRNFFRDNSGPVSGALDLKVAFAIVSGLEERIDRTVEGGLAGWRLLLLTLGGDVHVVIVVSFHFSLPQWDEEFSGGNFMLRRQLWVIDSRGRFCRLLGRFVGVVCRLLLSTFCTRNSSLDGGAAMMVLAVYPLAGHTLRTAIKSCSTSV
jgi:hypothetical protein